MKRILGQHVWPLLACFFCPLPRRCSSKVAQVGALEVGLEPYHTRTCVTVDAFGHSLSTRSISRP